MQTFILLTRLIREEVSPAFSIAKASKEVTEKVREYLPSVKWTANYAVLGPWDYVDIFEAPDTETAMKLSSLVRYYGGAHTEVWPAAGWDEFKETIRDLAETMEK